jgi:hypothetical protein
MEVDALKPNLVHVVGLREPRWGGWSVKESSMSVFLTFPAQLKLLGELIAVQDSISKEVHLDQL